MNATVIDLRYKMSQVLSALENREIVNVLYHGKLKGVIMPVTKKDMLAQNHEYFGSHQKGPDSVDDEMIRLRGGRYRDI